MGEITRSRVFGHVDVGGARGRRRRSVVACVTLVLAMLGAPILPASGAPLVGTGDDKGSSASTSSSAASGRTGPVYLEGNPRCSDVDPSLTQFKVDPPREGTFTDGTITVTISNIRENRLFDWTSNIGVDLVMVKGGPNANVWTYDPEATSDVDQHSPVNPKKGKFYGLSHVQFCYDVGPGANLLKEVRNITDPGPFL